MSRAAVDDKRATEKDRDGSGTSPPDEENGAVIAIVTAGSAAGGSASHNRFTDH
jgi:hypothetical protein